METCFAFDEQLSDIIKIKEDKHFPCLDKDTTKDMEIDSFAASSVPAHDKDVVALYLKELGTYQLLTNRDEHELSREIVEQEQKKQKLAGQLMLLVAQMVNKRLLLTAQADRQPTVRLCMAALSVQQQIKTLERSMQKCASGTYNRKKLSEDITRASNTFREIVSRVDLRVFKDRTILEEIKIVRGVNVQQKVKFDKVFLRIVQEIAAAEVLVQAARDRLVKSNLRLVLRISRRYLNKGVPLADLIQEGNLGLMRAAEKFDYRCGCRFSTYAFWWIRQSIVRCVDGQAGNSICLPVYMRTLFNNMRKITRQTVQDTGAEPAPVSLAAALGISSQHLDEMQRIVLDTISLETPVGKERSPLQNLIVSPSAVSPLEEILQNQQSQTAVQALKILAPREQKIIRLRFGIGIDTEHTLDEIGKQLGVSRERVRQIEVGALRKLRCSAKAKQLLLCDHQH